MLNWSMTARAAKGRNAAQHLCAETIARARAPVFFTRLGVADSVDGRFDLITLHAWLVLERLANAPQLSQAFVNEMFLGFDEGLRELGNGDMGMGRRLKTVANAFYGRLEAYRRAKDEKELATALLRNVYRGDPGCASKANALATYAWAARSHLARAEVERSAPDFGPLPDCE